MQSDGFQVVTDRFGQYKMDFEANKKCIIIFILSCWGFAANQKEKKKRIKRKKKTGWKIKIITFAKQ